MLYKKEKLKGGYMISMWEGFFDLVCEMRQSQRKYFLTRSPVALREAKRKDQAVDECIKYHLDKLAGNPQQGDLYQ
jgi:hypothetical protein